MYDACWSLGRFMFVREVPNPVDVEKKTLQNIIVTMEENHKDHLQQLPNFLIGSTVR